MFPVSQPNSVGVPYCQKAPRNAELNGLFQCQFQGADLTHFVGGVNVGAPGTIPFGQSSPLNPPGSCPAHPAGPIADGTQLVDQVSSPGVPSGNGTGSGNNQGSPPASPTPSDSSTPTGSSVPTPAPSSPASSPSASPSSGSTGFAVQNGKDAQALNQKFQSLTPDSPCTGNVIWCAAQNSY
jgi:hypothetical protein